MKKMMFVFAMVLAVGIYAADEKKAAAPKAEEAKVAAEMKKADADKDGKVTVAEYVAYAKITEADAKNLDKNADGVIQTEEFVVVKAEKAEKKGEKKAKAE